ncbi:MAG: N-6 DNA methylase, partial [Pelolinea sp.]|nr:N-6 DNA methylase [Pelolinea sp.]
MMNGDMKRKIDTLRDLLVGVLPVPTDQIKQITLALIYKFMSDQNLTLKELGGRDFFSGDYAPYAWTRLMDPAVSAHERVKLYRDGLEKMAANPHIPELFREIFRGAYLPFNNPATLDMFLKGVNEIEYTHSEDLGDAFEHLLSVMGAQGDAGQFRTPRHIIDFIVAAVDPQKGERVLDPACGTAGFLVSAYRHILKANTLPASDRPGSALAPDERQRLTNDFCGYDISSDMARLSRVNLYLHLFPDPKIYEYDTLTSLERWDEIYDCVLTNPPFMSPRGGIQPHNRFSIPSKRSEVLFVDYILDHLAPDGKAGIIVPEGIIFQSQNAHKALRKKLVEENYLYAVVSLPAGIFQPYSGVKTSILLIDRALARRSKDILFVKVEADGFDLGAQRNPIEKNDLPEAIEIINQIKHNLIGESEKKLTKRDKRFLIIEKEKIIGDGEFTISFDRYRESVDLTKNKWPFISIADLCEKILSGGTPSTKIEKYWKGNIPWITSADIVDLKTAKPRRFINEDAIKNSATNLIPKNNIIVVTRVGLGKLFLNNFDVCISQDSQGLILKQHIVKPEYLVYILQNEVKKFQENSQGSTIQGVTKNQLESIKIPLPPLEVQREIVEEIEGYQKIIDGARMVVENWKPRIKVDPGWPRKKIGQLCKLMTGGTPSSTEKRYYENGTIRWLVSGDIHKREIVDC